MSDYATALINEPTRNPPKIASSTNNLFGSLDGQSESAQQMHRLAARLNASAVSDKEAKGLLDERQRLLDKHFAGTITKKEKNRLEYVRWSLDRIEDARNGAWLDKLDARIAEFNKIAEHLEHLQAQLQRATASNQGPRRRR
jgi:hypothetical protein